MEEIFTRRSVRSYEDKEIPQEIIEKLLRAGMQAPSARNQQPWEFVVVKDKTILKELSQMSPTSPMVEKSAATFVLLMRTDLEPAGAFAPQDMGACTQNIMLEAASLGLGSVWIGVLPRPERMEYVKNVIHAPDHVVPFCMIALGYPAGQGNHFIDRFDSSRIQLDKY